MAADILHFLGRLMKKLKEIHTPQSSAYIDIALY